MIQSREDARRLINELKQKGMWFNAWLNSLDYETIMHMKQGEMAKYRDVWEEGYQRGREYGQNIEQPKDMGKHECRIQGRE